MTWGIFIVYGLIETSRPESSKKLFYEDYFDKGIQYTVISLIHLSQVVSSLKSWFSTLKFLNMMGENSFFFMKCIPSLWLEDSNSSNVDLFDTLTEGLPKLMLTNS